MRDADQRRRNHEYIAVFKHRLGRNILMLDFRYTR
jgi:hypothetical protein